MAEKPNALGLAALREMVRTGLPIHSFIEHDNRHWMIGTDFSLSDITMASLGDLSLVECSRIDKMELWHEITEYGLEAAEKAASLVGGEVRA